MTIKFKLNEDPQVKEVFAKLEKDVSGNVVLKVNGIVILWLNMSGIIVTCCLDENEKRILENLGFILNHSKNEIKIL